MKVRANAKVNLSLDVTGKRQDGYHTLCSVMQSVSLGDVIELTPDSKISVICDKNELSGEGNLAFRAAKSFFSESAVDGGVKISIQKKIPVAGGLGGGSADAAAVLWALNRMHGEPLSNEKLSELALTLGADVPFCVNGGTVLAEGIGEQMSKLPDLPEAAVVIAKKGIKSSTGDMYRKIDSTEPEQVSDVDSIVFGLINGDLKAACKGFYNRFEEVAEPEALEECKTVLIKRGCLYAGLSGAGPSVVGIFGKEDSVKAEEAAAELKSRGFESHVCHPAKCGVEIIE